MTPRRLSVLLVGLLVTASTATAQVIHVPGDHPTIQDAVNAAVSGDEIVVAPGTYPETVFVHLKSLTIRSSHGPAVTTIDGTGLAWTVVGFGACPSATLEGFTITGGNSTFDAGGVSAFDVDVFVLRDCHVVGNQAAADGGGGQVYDCDDVTIEGCIFRDNTCTYFGGGLAFESLSGNALIEIVDCTFENNEATDVFSGLGGGLHLGPLFPGAGPYRVTDSHFVDNHAQEGGGVYAWNGAPVDLVQSVFYENTAGSQGGGALTHGGDVIHCSFTRNSASTWPAFYNQATSGTPATIMNSIIWDNLPTTTYFGQPVTVSHSIVQDGHAGTGNVTLDPFFVDAANGDLRLRPGSPCVDAGDNAAVSTTTDLAGNPRLVDDPGRADSGSGTAPIVDMGAYEHQGNSTGFVPSLTVTPDPMIGGQSATFTAEATLPQQRSFLVLSATGTGTTLITQLSIELDLMDPELVVASQHSNSAGQVSWTVPVPTIAIGHNVWWQVCQFGVKTNVVATSVQ